jgi:hypothetical protein
VAPAADVSAREDTQGGRGDPLEGNVNPLESISERDLAVLRLVIRQEVREGCAEAVQDVKADHEDLRAIVCGRADSDQGGLLSRVAALETKLTLAQWLAGIALASSLTAVAGILVGLLTHTVHLP